MKRLLSASALLVSHPFRWAFLLPALQVDCCFYTPSVSRCASSASASPFSVAFSTNGGGTGDIPTAVYPDFHTVLEQIGKTALNPGGTKATERMHSWSGLCQGKSAIELSAGLGRGGMALAEKYGCEVLLTDKNCDRLDKAEKAAVKRGLSTLVRTREMNMLDIGTVSDESDCNDVPHFDCALVEAAMLFQPRKSKANILNAVAGVSSRLLIHDMCLRNVEEDSSEAITVTQEMGRALGTSFRPETASRWKELLDSSGWTLEHVDVGPLRVVDPKTIWRDEGPGGCLRIIWNLASKKQLRSRMMSTRKVINKHHDRLGYIIMSAVSKGS